MTYDNFDEAYDFSLTKNNSKNKTKTNGKINRRKKAKTQTKEPYNSKFVRLKIDKQSKLK